MKITMEMNRSYQKAPVIREYILDEVQDLACAIYAYVQEFHDLKKSEMQETGFTAREILYDINCFILETSTKLIPVTMEKKYAWTKPIAESRHMQISDFMDITLRISKVMKEEN